MEKDTKMVMSNFESHFIPHSLILYSTLWRVKQIEISNKMFERRVKALKKSTVFVYKIRWAIIMDDLAKFPSGRTTSK